MNARLEADPIFTSTYNALLFAFRYSHSQYQPTPMARLMRGPIGNGAGLHGIDGAAQAGAIRAKVESLSHGEKSALIARFAAEPKERYQAMLDLTRPATASLGTGVHNRRMVGALIQRHYGERCWLKELAEEYGVHANTMTDRWKCIRRLLTELEHRGMDKVEAMMQEAGLVP